MEALKHFKDRGASFLKAPDVLRRQLVGIKAVLFDWDGVFNEGFKDLAGGSPFSEVDSMGVNLLRYGLWGSHRANPPAAIITGQNNPNALQFGEREHLHQVFMGYANKPEAFQEFLRIHGLQAREVAFFFDDVLDIPVARQCGFRVLIGHKASPMMELYTRNNGDVDYVTGCSGGEHGLREACEMMLVLLGRWNDVVDQRQAFSPNYQEYLAERNAVITVTARKQH
jgi:3-deoxy-D-manno-octulosonate 8-phosphate phosphatase (KDO 8-P phosphatase)